jgi:hypothetical protein
MSTFESQVEARFARLEKSLHRTRLAASGLAIALTLVVATGAQRASTVSSRVSDEVRTRRLVVLDDRDVIRVEIGQDPKDGLLRGPAGAAPIRRRARSAGLWLYDTTGNERGGMGTFDDGQVSMALDAPAGVGARMRDRIGMVVSKNGASQLMLIDNNTAGLVRLSSDGNGNGSVDLMKWDTAGKKVHIKSLVYDGEKHATFPCCARPVQR